MTTVLLVTAGCTDSSKGEDQRPLPTTAASGELACGFVSQESVAVALGTTDFTATGSKVDAGTNPDGSSLAQAICDFYADTVKGDRALIVAVQPLGLAAKADAIVPRVLAAGGAQFVFPASDGEGFATSDQVVYSGAGVSHLIRGDWHYTVAIQKAVEGRNAVDDAVALTRQVVATLNLPKVGTKPRPTVTPAK
ncbi:hypothetical protein [Kribbella albertanoniae]|uniref:DUF3558 domain-containing protein n=1 Tax=Kribbella albertanoniae TaxID=1266829 RepID=A0A4V2XSA5_9ACTN|nr:hypothetical protein [Kribbella albertanoniae]TDC33065.1 hypothetical protein E1261_07055 [Kribbella albertanoniae]